MNLAHEYLLLWHYTTQSVARHYIRVTFSPKTGPTGIRENLVN